MPRKQKSTAKLVGEAADLMQKLVRMKAANQFGITQCVSCGTFNDYKKMDGGHFISRKYAFHKLREENIHPQCKQCNRFFSGCHDDYRRYMVDMYGEDFVDWLSETKWTIVKWDRHDLMDQIVDLKQKIKDQEARLAGL